VIEIQLKKACCSIVVIFDKSRTPFDKTCESLMIMVFKEVQLKKIFDENDEI
jgi:hypothetical protein